MEQSIFTQLTLVLLTAAAISLVMRLLKQPLIMGYILTGIVVGPSILDIIHAKEAFEGFSEIGIMLLLFIIGMGLNPGVIKSLGRPVLVTAAAILLLVGSTGFGIGSLIGFNLSEAVILGLALFFSSTIIILKVISDKRELSRLYAQISVGVIVVDDVIATLALLTIATIASGGGLGVNDAILLAGKGLAVALGLYFVSAKVIPPLAKFLARSQELLFLFAIAWGFGVAILFDLAGFSLEVGALFGGVSLAALPYATEMAAKLKPLRDFFIVLFFVTLGETFTFGNIAASLVPALVLSAIVIIGKPLFVMGSLGALGYTRLTSFKAGIHLSQISEFSIILVVFASSVGFIDAQATAIITLVALITIGVSTYLMKYDDQLYRAMEHQLRIFERKDIKERKQKHALYPVILLGYHKGGHEFLAAFREMKKRYLVVDYDPEIIEHLEAQGVRHVYGDATDQELLEEINASKAELIVSTITDFDANKAVLTYLRRHNPEVAFICHANNYDEAASLYGRGASYVILPHFIGSERISGFIKRNGYTHGAFDDYRRKHLVSLGKTAIRS
jgi:Kef-type K+ transport system membrane component KefB